MERRRDLAIVAGVLLAFLVPTLAAIGAQIALGYDEAVYAQLARHWLTGAPESGWEIHRPPGLSVLGIVPQALGLETEWAHRLIGAGAGLGMVLAGWWAARGMGGTVAGIVAAFAFAVSSPLQVESSSFLTDVPSTLILVVVAILGWRHVSGSAPIGWSFVWLGLLAAVAFYLRYGSVVELVGVAVAMLALAPRRLLAAWRAVLASVASFGIALVPHVAVAVAETGSPWGILVSAGRAAGGGDGLPLLSYVVWFPWQLVGPTGAVLAMVGIIAAVRRGGFARYIGLASVVPVAVLGTIVHAEPRYLLFPMVLLVIAGSVEAVAQLQRVRVSRRVLAALAAAAVVLGAATTTLEMGTRADRFDWKREAGLDIGDGGGDCSVLAEDVPIISWYSGCPAVSFVTGPEALTGSSRFVIVSTDGHLQSDPEVVSALVAEAEVWRTYEDANGDTAAVVYRLR